MTEIVTEAGAEDKAACSGEKAASDHPGKDDEDACQGKRVRNAVMKDEDAKQDREDHLAGLGRLNDGKLPGVFLHQIGRVEEEDGGDDSGKQGDQKG